MTIVVDFLARETRINSGLRINDKKNRIVDFLTIISATADCHFWPIARHNMHVISYLWHYGYEMINVSDRAPGIIRNKQHIPRHRKVILYMSSSSSGGISVFADMHCVTRWSRFDNHWEGLLTTELMKRVKLRPQARHVMVHAEKP
jgi:hypothetical protein